MSTGEAALMAEQRMKNEGLFGILGDMKAMGTPEGAVVAIVETFLKSLVQQLIAEPAVARMVQGSSAHAEALARHNAKALAAIENHRRKAYGGSSDYPTDLKSYIQYRMGLEMTKVHGIAAEEMGLDRDVLDHMVDQACDYFQTRIGNLR